MKFTLAISALAAAAFVSASASSGPSEGLLSAGEVRALDRKAHHSAIAMEKRYKVYKGGDITYYYGGQLSNPACGGPTPGDNDMVVAVPESSPAKCHDWVHLHYNGKMVAAKVVDKCAGCKQMDVDATKGVFKKLAPLSEGRLKGVHMRVMGN